MSHLSRLFLFVCLSLVAGACAHHYDGKPSVDAQDMPGARGTFAFKPSDWMAKETTRWKDTDGVNPGVAGCHIGTDDKGAANGRTFGATCLPNGLLVN